MTDIEKNVVLPQGAYLSSKPVVEPQVIKRGSDITPQTSASNLLWHDGIRVTRNRYRSPDTREFVNPVGISEMSTSSASTARFKRLFSKSPS